MWIAFRIAIALLAFLARWIWPVFRSGPAGTFAGRPFYRKIEKTKKGDVTSFRIGMPLAVPFVFRLQREQPSDRWLKDWGFAEEFQTGDLQFDDKVYIACDHPAMHRMLKEKPAARARIVAVLDGGYQRIVGDGRVVWIERIATEEPGNRDLQVLENLRAALTGISPALSYFRDPFNLRVVAVEALTWSLFAYAAGGFIEWSFNRAEVHLEPSKLVLPGLVCGAVLFALLALLVRWLLGKSSRGGRILTEGMVLLAISAPIAGIQLFADLNRALDRSEPSLSRWVVQDKVSKRARRGATTYYLMLGSTREGSSPDYVPGELRVNSDVYYAASKGGHLQLDIGRGAFGHRWYRAMTVK